MIIDTDKLIEKMESQQLEDQQLIKDLMAIERVEEMTKELIGNLTA